jgi:hypothetical protein
VMDMASTVSVLLIGPPLPMRSVLFAKRHERSLALSRVGPPELSPRPKLECGPCVS